MKLVTLAGILILLLGVSNLSGYEIENPQGALKVICELFPQTYKEKCAKYLKESVAVKSGISILANIPVGTEKKKDEVSDSNQAKCHKACSICKRRIFIYEYIVNHKWKACQVQKIVLASCEIFSRHIKHKCISFYKGVGFKVIKGIVKYENPEKICQLLGLCRKGQKDVLNEEFQNVDFILMALENHEGPASDKCKKCIRMYGWLEKNINYSKTAKEVQKIMLNQCDILRDGFKKKCQHIYSSVGFDVIRALWKKMDPKKICSRITHQCQREKTDEKSNDIEKKADLDKRPSRKCYECRNVVSIFERILNMSMTAVQIQKQFIDTCQVVRSPMREKWIKFLQTDGIAVIQKLLNKEKPKDICKMKNVCDKLEDEHESFETLVKIQSALPGECSICKLIMAALEKILSDDNTEQEIIKALDTACYFLPSAQASECVDFNKKYINEIIKFLTNGKTADMVCDLLKACANKDVKPEDTLFYLPKIDYF